MQQGTFLFFIPFDINPTFKEDNSWENTININNDGKFAKKPSPHLLRAAYFMGRLIYT